MISGSGGEILLHLFVMRKKPGYSLVKKRPACLHPRAKFYSRSTFIAPVFNLSVAGGLVK